jgi:chromosome segregation ATPase
MTKISKCLAVLATVASLAFLGVVSLSAVGGPNYEAEISDSTLKGVLIEKNIDESTGKVTWSATTASSKPGASDGQIAKDAKVLPDVIIKSQQKVQQQQSQKIKDLEARIDQRKRDIAEANRLYPVDLKAMDDRIASLEKQLAARHAELTNLKNDIIAKRDGTLKKKKEVERRQNDIRRLGHLIAELRADRERLAVQQKKLEVLIETIRGTNRRLEQRKRQLIERTTSSKAAAVP